MLPMYTLRTHREDGATVTSEPTRFRLRLIRPLALGLARVALSEELARSTQQPAQRNTITSFMSSEQTFGRPGHNVWLG